MKKIIAALAFTTLLFGCFGSGPAEPSDVGEDSAQTGVELNDDLFIALSAEILCLPNNNEVATADEIEVLAKAILANADVSEESFSVYQQTIEADPQSKQNLSLAIVGKMADFCTLAAAGEIEVDELADDTHREDIADETHGEDVDDASETPEEEPAADEAADDTEVADEPAGDASEDAEEEAPEALATPDAPDAIEE